MTDKEMATNLLRHASRLYLPCANEHDDMMMTWFEKIVSRFLSSAEIVAIENEEVN